MSRAAHLVLFLVLLVAPVHAQLSLLGQTALRAGVRDAATYTLVDFVEEQPLQVARGETGDRDRPCRELWNGAYAVDAATWVLGEGAVKAGLAAAGIALGPFAGAMVANFGAELVSNAAVNAYKHKRIDPTDLIARSAFSAAGGAIGQALLPGLPLAGYIAGVLVADFAYERLTARPAPKATSKPVEWYAGDAPPLGLYRKPVLRGQSFM